MGDPATIAVVDYGVGNLHSVCKALKACRLRFKTARSRPEFEQADAFLLPGVGAFEPARRRLAELGLDDLLRREAQGGKPLLGICLGMQLLFEASEEGGRHEGLALLPGVVRRIRTGLKLPHIGWNQVEWERGSRLVEGLRQGFHAYFVHGYAVSAASAASSEMWTGETEYGARFLSAVARGRIWGTQFHPEKSGRDGLRIIRNFGAMCGAVDTGD